MIEDDGRLARAARAAAGTLLLLVSAHPFVAAQDQGRMQHSVDEKRGTEGWGRMGRYTDGDEWYRRNLAADLRSLRKNLAALEASTESGGDANATARAARAIAKAARSARRDLLRGDLATPASDSSRPPDEAPLAERVGELETNVTDVCERVATASRTKAVDVRALDETASLLVRIEATAHTIEATAAAKRGASR